MRILHLSTRFSHKYRFGRENGTTKQWLVVDSITIVLYFAGCQVDASHNVSVGRENVTNKYVACMACILIVFQLLTSYDCTNEIGDL